jgi:hypothetical protein
MWVCNSFSLFYDFMWVTYEDKDIKQRKSLNIYMYIYAYKSWFIKVSL